MSALVHLGANGNSSKQKPILSRHQNAITASAGGDPYPTANVVSLVFGLGRYMHSLTHSVTYFESTGRMHEGQTPETQGRQPIRFFVREGSH